METKIQDNSPSVELPNDENKLFDEADDVGNSTTPDLSLPSEVDEEEHTINNVWEYAINDIFQLSTSHVEGKSLRRWVHSQQMKAWINSMNGKNMLLLLEQPKPPTRATHGPIIQNAKNIIPSKTYRCLGNIYTF